MTEKTIILPPNGGGSGGDASYKLTVMVPKRRYFSYLRERWWVVMIFVAVAVAAMFAIETIQPDNFQSSAQLYMRGEMQVGVNTFSEDPLNYYGTQIELLKSARLHNAAMQKINYVPAPGQKGSYNIDVYQPGKSSILTVLATGPDPDTTRRFLQALIEEYLAYKKETRLSTAEDMLNSLTDQLTKKDKELQD